MTAGASASPLAPAPAREATRDLTSVVIVAADSGAGLVECVAAVLANGPAVEVLVVDNDSHDASIEQVEARFGTNVNVRVVRNGANLGFGKGCNRGAAAARGDALLFLNPDCMVDATAVASLRRLLDADSRIGLIGAMQVDAQGRVDPASRRHDPLLRRALASVSGFARLAPGAGVEIKTDPVMPAEDADAISGALMLMSRTAFDRVGGFDEGYFLHCEDLDLSRRVRDAGYRVVCATAIRVLHVKGGSSRARPVFVAWHKHRGMWRWFDKFDPAARNPLLRGLVWSGIWLAFAARLPLIAGRRALGALARQ